MLDLTELKRLHDKAYNANQVTRERAADDLVFYYITQWDDQLLQDSQLAYRGEFNIIRKAGRAIMSDLAANPVQVDFEPKDESRDDAAELLDGLYRSGANQNTSQEAFKNAQNEKVVCGLGAWELYPEYESMRTENNNQVIKRRPIFEANNTVFFDPNSKLLDKSDAFYCAVLTAYSVDGYKKLHEDLVGGEADPVTAPSFKEPEQSYAFPWIEGEAEKIYIVSFYHRKKVKDKLIVFINPVAQEITLKESDLKDVMDDLLDAGYEIQAEKEIERWEVTKYIASGREILASQVIPGEHIPVVPDYGERAIVEGEEHYEGVTRLAKDPQRLRNFQMSYLADIVSRSPRTKPIFLQEQIAGFEQMYSETGADNNYPYLLQNRVNEDGSDLPIGPVAQMPEQSVPMALIQSIALSREAVSDVADPGVPQDVADVDLSGKAVLALQNKVDQQSMVYQENSKHAKRRDGEVFASMASEVYDVPRRASITKPDGTRATVEIMETVIDQESGEIVVLNDIYNKEFEVFSDISPTYSSRKEQTVDRVIQMIPMLQPGDPIQKALILKLVQLTDGVDFDDIREYANKQLVLTGFKEPETPEEEQMLAEAQQQPEQPSAEMMLAMAEMEKAKADQAQVQLDTDKLQVEGQNESLKRQVDSFNAQTKRMEVQIDAEEAGAKINKTNIEAFGEKIDNSAKINEMNRAKLPSLTQNR